MCQCWLYFFSLSLCYSLLENWTSFPLTTYSQTDIEAFSCMVFEIFSFWYMSFLKHISQIFVLSGSSVWEHCYKVCSSVNRGGIYFAHWTVNRPLRAVWIWQLFCFVQEVQISVGWFGWMLACLRLNQTHRHLFLYCRTKARKVINSHTVTRSYLLCILWHTVDWNHIFRRKWNSIHPTEILFNSCLCSRLFFIL